MPQHKHFDFNKPADARKFLTGFRLAGGQQITKVKSAGMWVELANATDEQVMNFASQLYTELYVPGGPYYVEEVQQ